MNIHIMLHTIYCGGYVIAMSVAVVPSTYCMSIHSSGLAEQFGFGQGVTEEVNWV